MAERKWSPYPYSGVIFAYRPPLGQTPASLEDDARRAADWLTREAAAAQLQVANVEDSVLVFPNPTEGATSGQNSFVRLMQAFHYKTPAPSVDQVGRWSRMLEAFRLPLDRIHPGDPHAFYRSLWGQTDTDNRFGRHSLWPYWQTVPTLDVLYPGLDRLRTVVIIGEDLALALVDAAVDDAQVAAVASSSIWCGDGQEAWEEAAKTARAGNFAKCLMLYNWQTTSGEVKSDNLAPPARVAGAPAPPRPRFVRHGIGGSAEENAALLAELRQMTAEIEARGAELDAIGNELKRGRAAVEAQQRRGDARGDLRADIDALRTLRAQVDAERQDQINEFNRVLSELAVAESTRLRYRPDASSVVATPLARMPLRPF